MIAKVLQNMDSFLGKPRKAGDIISEEEMSRLPSKQLVDALVSQHVLEIEGLSAAPGAPASADVSALQASFDRFREETQKAMADLSDKLDAALAGKKPRKARTKE